MVDQGGLAMSPVSSGGIPARKNSSELGNAALPALDSGQGGYAKVEEALARLLAGWLGRRQRGELGRSGRFAVELAEDEVEKRESAGEGNGDGWRSVWCRGVQEDVLELIGGAIDGVWSTAGRTRGGGRRLTKLNRVIQSPSAVSESQSSPMFYS